MRNYKKQKHVPIYSEGYWDGFSEGKAEAELKIKALEAENTKLRATLEALAGTAMQATINVSQFDILDLAKIVVDKAQKALEGGGE